MEALGQANGWDVSTVAGAVLHGGRVVETAGPTDAPFRLASVTKLLTAVVAAVAVEEGTLVLDAAVDDDGRTPRQLLAHASGLGAAAGEPARPPLERRLYSNHGFEVLGEHLAARAGMPITDYWQAAIVDGIGLTSTRLLGSVAHAAESSVDDLAAVLATLRSGALLAPETMATMITPQFAELDGILPGFGRQSPNIWGLGVEIRGDKSPHWTGSTNSTRTWGHFGQAGTFVWVDPPRDLSLIVLTDRDFGPWAKDAWPALSDRVVEVHG